MEEVAKNKSLERGDASEQLEIVIETTPFEDLDEHVKIAFNAVEEKKAINTIVLDLRDITSFTEFFVVASGSNQRQVQAIADEVRSKLKKQIKFRASRIEGYDSGEWVLLDYGDFIVHVFNEKFRDFYELERLWRDAKRVELPES